MGLGLIEVKFGAMLIHSKTVILNSYGFYRIAHIVSIFKVGPIIALYHCFYSNAKSPLMEPTHRIQARKKKTRKAGGKSKQKCAPSHIVYRPLPSDTRLSQ